MKAYFAGSAWKGGQRQLVDHWNRYKAASHLWLADRLLGEKLPEYSEDEFLHLLAYAEAYRLLGCGYTPTRARGPLLGEEEVWEIETDFELPLVSFSADSLSSVFKAQAAKAPIDLELSEQADSLDEEEFELDALGDADRKIVDEALRHFAPGRFVVDPSRRLLFLTTQDGTVVESPLDGSYHD